MIKVKIAKQSNYPVSGVKIKRELIKTLKENGLVSNAHVSVAIVNESKMLEVSKKYKDKKLHNVLSFPFQEKKDNFEYPNDGIIRLGDIVVCFPLALEEAKKENMLIDDKVIELVNHGAMHLLGTHHD